MVKSLDWENYSLGNGAVTPRREWNTHVKRFLGEVATATSGNEGWSRLGEAMSTLASEGWWARVDDLQLFGPSGEWLRAGFLDQRRQQ